MPIGEGASKVASGTIEALKSQPLALALVVINVLFLAAGMWVLKRTADGTEQWRGMVQTMIRECVDGKR